MDKLSQTDKCVMIEKCKISQLLFLDDLIWMASLKFGLQHALNGFAAACDIAGMKTITSKTEVLHLSKNPGQCSQQVGSVSLNHFVVNSQLIKAKTK